MFLGSGVGYAGDYADSAHGNTGYGVDRTSTSQYTQGHCAHCHEQHASIGGTEPAPKTGDAVGPDKFCLLANNFDTAATPGSYTEDDNACFYCHTSNLACLQDGGITNNDYSETFGEGSGGVTGIMQAFNQTSFHNLNDVLNFAKTNWSSTFTDNSNPCSGCHNVHLARRNKANKGDPAYTAISKPSVHDSLWGAGGGETLRDYTTNYQAPYSDTFTPKYEPDASISEPAGGWGSNMPDYVTLCLDCHSNAVTSTTRGRSLVAIDWSAGGDIHGGRARTGTCSWENHNGAGAAGTGLKLPYVEATANYVLSCTDCHEPHGSAADVFLLRNFINGEAVTHPAAPNNYATGYWASVCEKCHIEIAGSYASMGSCWGGNSSTCCHATGTYPTRAAHGATTCMCSDEPSF